MLKDIFNRLISLIFRPSQTWIKLKARKDDKESFLSSYLYPLIGLVALAAFLGVLLSYKEFNIEIALKATIKALVSYGGGFFLSAYILNEVWQNYFKRSENIKQCQAFVGYSSSAMFLISIILSLLPEFFFLHAAVLYTLYLIWTGVIPYMEVNKEEQFRFSVLASAVIMIPPVIIRFLLFILMPGLRL
ncbi:MAG: YIP1 family protein [Tannerella sp.]|nr:YIP1 family protein [Tannerella sp.]